MFCPTINPEKAKLEHLQAFEWAIKNNQNIVCERSGRLFKANLCERIFYWIVGHDRRLVTLSRIFMERLDQIELSKTPSQKGALYEGFVKVGYSLCNSLSQFHSEKVNKTIVDLKQRIIGLEYRAEIIKPESQEKLTKETREIFEKLKEEAADWKHQIGACDTDKEIQTPDESRLIELASHTKFAHLVLEDEDLRQRVFNWIIRTRNCPQEMIFFPAMQHKLRISLLTSRLGYFDGEPLRIHRENGTIDLQIAFNTGRDIETGKDLFSWISILDQKAKVHFHGGLVYTIEQIFKNFAKKKLRWCKLEMSPQGIIPWNCGRMSRPMRNAAGKDFEEQIKLDRDEWWKQIPIVKWVSLEDVQATFPKLNLEDGKNWIRRNMATRLSPELRVFGTHAYRKIYIPEARNGEKGYAIYDFSKFPVEESFPRKWHQFITFGAKTHRGVIGNDVTCFNAERHQGGTLDAVTPEVGEAMMEDIREAIQRGRDGLLAYNLFVSNCAGWTMEDVRSLLFRVKPEKSKPAFPLDLIFKKVMKMRPSTQDFILSTFFKMLGGSQAHRCVYKVYDRATDTFTKYDREVSVLSPHCKVWGKYSGLYMIPASARKLFALPGIFHNTKKYRNRMALA